MTARACQSAIGQLRYEHASINELRRQQGTERATAWDSLRPRLGAADPDQSRFDDVHILGVDERVWRHIPIKRIGHGGRSPKELRGIVDLTRGVHGRTRARLLDLVPGRSGKAYKDWLTGRYPAFCNDVEVAMLDPFHGTRTR